MEHDTNATRHAHTTAKTLITHMERKVTLMKSLTLDNDTAFAQHHKIGKDLQANIFFCDPYKSWQKGSIENGNRLIREKLPLKTSISQVKQWEVDRHIESLNNRPMKLLGYKSPSEVFLHEASS